MATPGKLGSIRAHHVALALAAVFGILACALDRGPDGPVQGWWSQRGPVVPHDSFPGDCLLCHEGSDWTTIRSDFVFDHAAETGHALLGAHAEAECLRCHNDRGPVAQYMARGCAGCHEDVHRGQLGKGCADCHDELSWRPDEQVAKHLEWGFPLVGRHAAAACWRCHPNAQAGNFTRTPTTCVECHADDLATAQNPDHVAQGWVANCNECHIPTSWTGGGFNHPWPLTGAHATAACDACHAGGIFGGTPTQCYDCHMADYQGAADPDHVALNISTSCELCHNTTTWQGANFNHIGITNNCVMCHLSDYQGTTDPDHAAANFPTTCENCHNTSAWEPANFAHTFPITSGKHKNFDCSDCHLNPTNFMSFSCTHCHEHNQSEMDDKHDDVSGYVWSSPACFQCHPDGKE